jgi:hypothetical protein
MTCVDANITSLQYSNLLSEIWDTSVLYRSSFIVIRMFTFYICPPMLLFNSFFLQMSNEKIPIQTFLEALLNLCSSENVKIGNPSFFFFFHRCPVCSLYYHATASLLICGIHPH